MRLNASGARLSRRGSLSNAIVEANDGQRRTNFLLSPSRPLGQSTSSEIEDRPSSEETESNADTDEWNWSAIGIKRRPEPVVPVNHVRRGPWRPDW